MKLNKFSIMTFMLLLGSSSLFGAFGSMSLSSSTHDTTNPTQATSIVLSWAAPTVTGSTVLNGYYCKLDEVQNTLITSSDTVLAETATSKTETVTGTNIEKSYYFHIAPYATNGDIGATAHYGPIKIDTKAPTNLTISPSGGSYSSVQNVSISAIDGSNYSIHYTDDGSTPTAQSPTFPLGSSIQLSSTKTIKAIAIDSAGNESGVETVAFTINLATNVAHFGNEVTFGSTIATNSNGNSSNIISTVSVDGSDVTHYKYKVDTDAFSAEIAKSTPIDLSSLSDGTHTISIVGYDGTTWQADSSATTLSFTVDNTAPDNVTFSTASGTISTDTTITMSSSNSDNIYYTIDGTTPSNTSINSSTLELTSANNGTLTLKAIAYDRAMNKSTPTDATYTIAINASTTGTTSGGGTTEGDSSSSDSTTRGISSPSSPAETSSSTTQSFSFSTSSGNEVVNITTHIEGARRVTNSDGTTLISASTANGVNSRVQLNSDGTLDNSVTIGTARADIEVNTIGADVAINADGSMQVSSTIPNSGGGSIVSNAHIGADGTVVNSLNITTADGVSTQTVLNSNIAGTDTVIGGDGSITITTPTVTTATGQNIDFEIVLDSSGQVTPTITVDGETILLPQFDAGTILYIDQELDRILLNIETILAQPVTFN